MSNNTTTNIPSFGILPSIDEKIGLSSLFPKLIDNEWHKTAERTGYPNFPPYDADIYNCIAWSLCLDDIGWVWSQVDAYGNDDGIVDINDFDNFYREFGLEVCTENINCLPQCKIRKVALFEKDGELTHAVKEISDDGWWESKLGGEIKIIHKLEQLEGGDYGNVIRCYCRNDDSANHDRCIPL